MATTHSQNCLSALSGGVLTCDCGESWAAQEAKVRARDAAAPTNCKRSGPWRRVLGFCPACGSGELALDGDGRLCCNTTGECPEPRAIDKELRGRFYERRPRGEETEPSRNHCSPHSHNFQAATKQVNRDGAFTNFLFCTKCGEIR